MYTERINKEAIESSFQRPFITAILGPRRVGKSLFVQHYAENHSHLTWVFLNMDDMLQRERVEKGRLEELIIEAAKQYIRLLSKPHLVVKIVIFGIFIAKFFNHMFPYAFKICR